MSDIQSDAPAIMPFLKRDENGKPYLAGSRCEACGQIFVGEPDPEKIEFDMPVRLVYREAVPVNGGGKPYLAYFFVPA